MSVPPDRTSRCPPPQPPQLSVLVVDGYPGAAESMARLLGLARHDARPATSGFQALRLLDGWPAQAALIDLHTAGVPGCDLARFLREVPHPRPVLTVGLTARGAADEWEEAERAGFDCLLRKPLDPSFLTALLGRYARELAA